MQKISADVLEKMMKSNLSSKEVDFILYVAQYQNNYGVASGIYYKDVCEALNLSYQGFYNCRAALEEKGIIRSEKKSYYDCDITILNNEFDPEHYDRGYVNIHVPMIQDPRFRELKAGAKLMGLWLMREWLIYKSKTKQSGYQILKVNFMAKFREMLGLTNRVIRSYLGALEPFLSVYLEAGKKYFITFREEYVRAGNRMSDSENGVLRSHLVRVACRRNRVASDPEKEREIIDILSIHDKDIRKFRSFPLSGIIADTLAFLNQNVRSKYKWKRYLNPSLIHKEVMAYI